MKQRILIIKLTFLSFFLSIYFSNAQQWGEYTLYSTSNSNIAYLIDTNGTTYHTWTMASTSKTCYSSYLLPGGTLVRTVARTGNSFSGGPICGEVQKVDYSGNVIWDYVYSTSTYCTHHDICPMPNGNVLLISYESKTAAEATQAGSSTNIVMWPEKIVEIQPSGATGGNVVWEWHVWDHLCQTNNSAKDNYVTSIVQHPELLNINYKTTKDWMHANGIDYNPQLDQIVFSSHNLNEIYVIDHSTTTAQAAGHTGGNSGKGGDFLFRWGNPAAYGATGTTIFNVVHDAHWIPQGCPKAGYLAAFNNNGVSATVSSIDMIAPPYNGYNYDLSLAPTTYTYRHACNGHSSNEGNSQMLPNGNLLVCVAMSGLIYEVDSNGTMLWSKTISGSLAQAFRYSACYISGSTPTTPTISKNGDTIISTLGNTYQWYFNGVKIAGATSQKYIPTISGNYQVQIIDATGCASNLSNQFNVTVSGIENLDINSYFSIYPNPSNGLLYIDNISKVTDFTISIYNIVGKCVYKNKNTNIIELSNLDNGVYLLNISIDKNLSFNKKISILK